MKSPNCSHHWPGCWSRSRWRVVWAGTTMAVAAGAGGVDDDVDVGVVVYMLGNGRGKQRAGRTGGARSVSRWRSSVLSTGERSIATTMIEGGHRVKAGQAVRVLDIPAQRLHGAWDCLHQHASG